MRSQAWSIPPLASGRQASSAGNCPLEGRETRQPHTVVLALPAAYPEKLPDTAQQLRLSGVSLERASQPNPPLSSPRGWWKAPFTGARPGITAVPGQSAVRERGSTASSESRAGGWRGQGDGCFPSTHVRSKQRKEGKKTSPTVLKQQLPCGPFPQHNLSSCERLA